MTGDARATTFVTGAAGFIGAELVRVLVRGIGFRFSSPALEERLQQVVGALHE
jgi:nucleoside-diphosphate-sugar epimerase